MIIHDKAVASPRLTKSDAGAPALIVTGRQEIAVRAGTAFGGHLLEIDAITDVVPMSVWIRTGTTFSGDIFCETDTIITPPEGGYVPGSDYAVVATNGMPMATLLTSAALPPGTLGGFHFAPGGNAVARAGGDDVPQINPFSVWDVAFRPACPDPRGMTLVDMPDGRKFWCDIYLTGADHLKNGTSAFGVTIADGNDRPQNPGRKGRFKQLDYDTARAVMAHHGKGLLSVEEFFVAAFGVTEKSAHSGDPKTTQLDAPRTSKWGVMQATGNMWVWGHDGDPDGPRASFFGGSWFVDDNAGSRDAVLAYNWPGYSRGDIGARGRGDHLQLD